MASENPGKACGTYRWKQKSQSVSLLTDGMRMGLACIFLPRITSVVSFGGKGLDVCSVFLLLDITNFIKENC